jgi:hypothetical protein
VVEERAHGAALPEDPRRQVGDGKAEGTEEAGEGSVELVAEASAPAQDNLFEERLLVQDDGLAQMDAQVLERDGELVAGCRSRSASCVGAVGRRAPIRFR